MLERLRREDESLIHRKRSPFPQGKALFGAALLPGEGLKQSRFATHRGRLYSLSLALRHADAPSPLSALQTSPHTVGSHPRGWRLGLERLRRKKKHRISRKRASFSHWRSLK